MPSDSHVRAVNAGAADVARPRTIESRTGAQASVAMERWLLRTFLRIIGNPAVQLVLWDGQCVRGADQPPTATIHIKDRPTLWRLIIDPELQFGEAYTDGRLEVDGDLAQLLETVYAVDTAPWVQRVFQRARRPRPNNIHRHYDLGNDFYRLWLDDRLVYTCAYFPTATTSLAEAQIAKMDLVSRKVSLRPGERVVEAGCGWGALALHMARHYGVTVRAFNISHEQICEARERARREGLADRVEFIEDDYRNLSGQYDVFMSVGMLEHVGTGHYRELGRVIDRCLPAHGRGLIHTIGRNRPVAMNAWTEKHIFPGAYTPTLREMMDIFEPVGLSVLDVENLRLHYAKTLENWLDRFETSAGRVAEMFDARFVRAWRLYLAGSIAGFRAGVLQLFQVSFARPRHNDLPWTRAHLYH
jgi:cyclopropane-fatty-acyl-phospholipid synthase